MGKAEAPATNPKQFLELYEAFNTEIQKDPVLANDAILRQMMTDFLRMSKMNDELWDDIQGNGCIIEDARTGGMKVNPSIGTYNKNATTLLKLSDVIAEKTKAIVMGGTKKTW